MVRDALQEGLARSARQPAVEGFRGVVVVTVVGYHLLRLLLTTDGGNWGSETSPAWWWAGTARFGVDVFFVLAGAFVTTSWVAGRERARSLGAAVADFARRRALRILPALYGIALLVGVPAVVVGRVSLGELALLLTTQQYLVEDLPERVALPLWSLTTEAQFYVVAPALALLVRRRGALPYVLVAVTLCTSIAWTGWSGRGDLAGGLLPGRLDQFVVGAVVGHLAVLDRAGERRWPVRLATARHAPLLLVGVLFALGTIHGATFQSAEGDELLALAVHPLGGVAIGGLVLRLLCGGPVPWLAHRSWRFLGLVSYSLYLWHYPLLDHGMDWFGLRGEPAPDPLRAVLASTVLVAAALLIATLSYALVERPFTKLRRRRQPDGSDVRGPTDDWQPRQQEPAGSAASAASAAR